LDLLSADYADYADLRAFFIVLPAETLSSHEALQLDDPLGFLHNDSVHDKPAIFYSFAL
jgi:hypothetical protein